MKYFVIAAFVLLVTGMTSDTAKVYISSNDITAFTYHKRKDCKKLVTHKNIVEVTQDSAINSLGFLPCPDCCDSASLNSFLK